MKAMLRYLFRKMWNNRWLTCSSLIGLLLATAFVSSIPLYTDSALSRIISDSLSQENHAFPPGALLIRNQAASGEYTELPDLSKLGAYITDTLPDNIGYDTEEAVSSYAIAPSLLVAQEGNNDGRRRQMSIMSQSGLAEHVDMTEGEWSAEGTAESGWVDAFVLESALSRNYLRVGDVYRYTLSTRSGQQNINIRIAGAFRPLDEQSDYWYQGLDSLANTLFINQDQFENLLLNDKEVYIQSTQWYVAFDLSALKTSDLDRIEGTLKRLETNLFQILPNTRVDISFLGLIQQFRYESLQLRGILFMLAAPMLGMVFYYIYTNAMQSLERQRNDIAVLRSRGASSKLIFAIYALEGVLLGLLAWAAGLVCGLWMARVIVSTDAFMRFVSDKGQAVNLSLSGAGYGLAAVALAIMAGTLPVIAYAKWSIVHYKQRVARADRKPLWQRWYLDVALVLVAAYGWYMFQSNQWLASQSGLSAQQWQVQPLFFFIPSLSIFALGLLVLRLFPLILKLIHRLLRRVIPVSLHLVLVQLSRSEKAYYPLMLLLVLTLGLGVYHASAARTIDLNTSDRIMYANGSDVVLQAVWEGETQLFDNDGNYIGDEEPPTVIYTEPPYEPFRTLPGVESAARVLVLDGELSASGQSLGKGTLMGIDNQSFARSAWFRNDLFTTHPYVLLRLLGAYEQAAIISQSFADKNGLQRGDVIQMKVQSELIDFIVVGITTYWPGQNPKASFVVANLDYIFDDIPLTPYAVWLNMEDGAKVMPVVESLRASEIETASVHDARNELILQKTQPEREGVFGILSLGFIVSVIISFIGYLLFWIFSLSRRTVQMGILRATGLHKSQLTSMLLAEQLLTTGLSMVLGIGIGRLVSRLFLPFLQVGGQEQALPFTIVFEAKDTWQLLAVVLAMLLIGAIVLIVRIRSMRVHQAVKLGEER